MDREVPLTPLVVGPRCILVRDGQCSIVEFNGAAEVTFGWSRNEVVGKLVEATNVPHTLSAALGHRMEWHLANRGGQVIG